MGTITFQVVGDASVGTKSKTYTLADSDINRLIAWAQTNFATPPTPQNPNPPALNVAQALVAWADGVISGTKSNVRNAERNAAHAAIVEPPDMPST